MPTIKVERADAASVADLMRLDTLLAGLSDMDRQSVERALAHHAAEAGGEYVTMQELQDVEQARDLAKEHLAEERKAVRQLNQRCVVLEARIAELEAENTDLRARAA